ncbi:hypothetical protein [Halopiger djelfimassiliensis]|uniref:hypothetical protein n=1 Tax=Halopiger djelfimassiliensis TaxID=1293047 RepID=UPI000677A9ED|nr:hypothetical protein [Halopiger djelfimassiliensis]
MTAIAGSGLALSSGSAAAAGKEYRLTVYADTDTGEYTLEIPDDDPIEKNTELTDDVTSLDDTAIVSGKVIDGFIGSAKDRYKFDNQAGWACGDSTDPAPEHEPGCSNPEDLVEVHELDAGISYDVEKL